MASTFRYVNQYILFCKCSIIKKKTHSITKRLKSPNAPTKLHSSLLDLVLRQLAILEQSQVGSVCPQTLSVDLGLSHPRLLAFDAGMVLFYRMKKLVVGWKIRSESCVTSSADDTGVPVDESAVDVKGKCFDLGPVNGSGLSHD